MPSQLLLKPDGPMTILPIGQIAKPSERGVHLGRSIFVVDVCEVSQPPARTCNWRRSNLPNDQLQIGQIQHASLICVSSSKCVYMCVKLRVHFGSILGPFWVHSGSILSPFWVHFGSILGPFWVHFGSILDPFWVHFGSILGPFWVHFGSILGPFWVHFGSILGPFWVHFAYCLSGDASFNQHLQESVLRQESVFTQESITRQESVFRQEYSLDKNSSLDC